MIAVIFPKIPKEPTTVDKMPSNMNPVKSIIIYDTPNSMRVLLEYDYYDYTASIKR